MLHRLTFEFPLALKAGIPAALCLLGLFAWKLRRAGANRLRVSALTFLRAAALGILVFLLSRPAWVESNESKSRREVVLLIDRSESMSLPEEGGTRYEKQIKFLRETLLPALNREKVKILPFLFSGDSEPADPDRIMQAKPDGSPTDLGGAIAHGLANTTRPLAVIAL
ncbi:MAG: VWA domain-containing protein, partial [Verrucomicrobiota bacterium]